MHSFRVWAPRPNQIELQVGRERFPMVAGANGWWQADVPGAKPGDDYGYLPDGEGPFPDPRSACQPHGVHGLSRLVDPESFTWHDQHFQAAPLSAALIYELHVGTFTPAGTFLSTLEKLEHLVALGVTHVELMPVAEFPGQHGWGYDGVDLYAPFSAYGAPDDLKKLVDGCHSWNLAVILDVVYNHLGPSGNYLAKFGPYFTKKFATFWGEGINFDGPESDEVRRFFCDNALMWLRDYHFDGLRLDAVHGILDTSATHFLEQLKIEVEHLSARTGRHLVLIPESDLNDPRLLWPRARGGYQLDAQWSDDFHHALHAVLTGERSGYYSDFGKLEHLARALRGAYVYDGKFSGYRRRVHGRPADGLNGHNFLGYLQNHDQVGNRALGERIGRLISPGRLKIGAALVLAAPFVPMLFQGEEWGAATPFFYFTDYPEPELANAVREGRCREFAAFGWKPEETPDPQAHDTFLHSILNWREPARPPHTEILDWHKRLIQLRRNEPSLADGEMKALRTRFDEDRRWFAFERGPLTVAFNLAANDQRVPLSGADASATNLSHPSPGSQSAPPARTRRQILIASETGVEISGDSVNLPPDSVVICKQIE